MGCSKCLYPASVFFRIVGMALAVASAAVMGTASSCTVYAAYGAPPVTVTYTSFPAFVYLVVAASIAAFMEAIAIFACVWKKGKGKVAKVLMPLLAALVPALLYTSAGAAFAIGWDISYLAANGQHHSVCRASVAGSFCKQVHESMWLALGAAVAVSLAELATTMAAAGDGGGCGGGSDSDSESACGHGCHCKH